MPAVVDKKKAVSKNSYRRAKKKAEKAKEPEPQTRPENDANSKTDDAQADDGSKRDIDSKPDNDLNPDKNAEAEPAGRAVESTDRNDFPFEIDEDHPLYEQFKDVFRKFQEPTTEGTMVEVDKPEVFYDDDVIMDEEEEEATAQKLSKRARKEMNKMSIAELKALVPRPELVEWTDVNSSDPKLLLNIKSHRNVIPVPLHWSLKREYLSSKRGIEKPPFALPKFIQETGISEMREAVLEKQEQQTLKQRQRERVQGKLGKLDIDYQKLYEAFFRRQTKPEMTCYGEVYYEGKEYETNLKHLRPGEISDELREALGIQAGHPPPWLINMQRIGPPPSYTGMRIPGLNAPPPPGGSWGFGPGQYGKPPVDEVTGVPLYGSEIWGAVIPEQPMQAVQPGEPVERGPWGELRPEGESEDEESEAEDEEEDEDEQRDDFHMDRTGVETSMTGMSELSSVVASHMGGFESVADFTLRKQRKGTETEETVTPHQAHSYRVIPERSINARGFFGGERAYDLSGARPDSFGEDNSRKRKAGDVDVSVDLDALAKGDKLNNDDLKKHYDAQKRAEQAQWNSIDQDDLNDMIAAESRKRLKKDDGRRGRR